MGQPLDGIEGDLVMRYLDDITIGGNVKDLISLVPKISIFGTREIKSLTFPPIVISSRYLITKSPSIPSRGCPITTLYSSLLLGLPLNRSKCEFVRRGAEFEDE